MGLKNVMSEITEVFTMLQGVFSALPVMVQFLIYLSFGGFLLILILRSVWG